jgi:hypothetical protein
MQRHWENSIEFPDGQLITLKLKHGGDNTFCERPLFTARNQTRLPFSKVGFNTVGQGSKAKQRSIN